MMKMPAFGDLAARGAAALLGRQGGAQAKPAAEPSAPAPTPAMARGVQERTMAANKSAQGNFFRRMGVGGRKASASPANNAALEKGREYTGLQGPIHLPPKGAPQQADPKASTVAPDSHKDVSTQASVKEQLASEVKKQDQLRTDMAKVQTEYDQLMAKQGDVQNVLNTSLTPGSESVAKDMSVNMSEQLRMAKLENPSLAPSAAPAPAPQGMKRKADTLDSAPPDNAKKPKSSPSEMHTRQANGWTAELNSLVDGFKAAEAKKQAQPQPMAMGNQPPSGLPKPVAQRPQVPTQNKALTPQPTAAQAALVFANAEKFKKILNQPTGGTDSTGKPEIMAQKMLNGPPLSRRNALNMFKAIKGATALKAQMEANSGRASPVSVIPQE
jgi:hypothetical protein